MIERAIEADLRLARAAARAAGAYLGRAFSKKHVVLSSRGRDLKLRADRQAEKIIISTLRAHSPYAILTEERGFLTGRTDSSRWIIDPLDGTFNFYRSIPFVCVSIALWRAGKPVLGVILDFLTGDIYEGTLSGTARKNGKKITVSAVRSPEQGVMFTGFPTKSAFTPRRFARFAHTVRSFKKIRLIGSAALSLAAVAQGSADIYREEDIALWDIAAGLALVAAAGGTYRLRKRPGRYLYSVTASNGVLAA